MRLYEVEPYSTFFATLPTMATQKSYHSPLSHFHIFLNGKPVLKATPDDVLRFYSTRKKWAVSTQSLTIAALNSFFKSLVKRRLIAENPASIIEGLSKARMRKPSPLVAEDREKLLASLQDQSENERLLKRALIVLLGIHAGFRVSEIGNSKFSDFNFVKTTEMPWGSVTFVGKGDKERTVPLSQRLHETVKRYKNVMEQLRGGLPGGRAIYLFQNPGSGKSVHRNYISDLLREQEQIAKIPMVSVHKLRHTFGTILAENGASPYVIRDLMGHASIATSEYYVGMTRGQAFQVHRAIFARAV